MSGIALTVSRHKFDVSALRADERVQDLIREAALETGVEVASTEELPAPFGSTRGLCNVLEFVYCNRASAHTDEPFDTRVFISLVVAGFHELGVARSGVSYAKHTLRCGTLFAFDPMRIHWANRLDHRSEGLLLLQWVVDRSEWRAAWRQLERTLPKATEGQS